MLKLALSGSPLNLSVPFLAKLALKFARGKKRIARFAAALNVRIDIPGLTEEQEATLLEGTIGTALDAAEAALHGQDVVTALSKRDTTREALLFVRENVDEFLGEGINIPLVPEWIEGWTAQALIKLIDERALPWVTKAQRLQ